MDKNSAKELISWLQNRKIVYKQIDENVFQIGEENFLLIESKYDKVFTTDMVVILDDQDISRIERNEIHCLVFQICDKFYFSREGEDFVDSETANEYGEISTDLHIKNFHELQYIGENSEECSFPHLGVHGSYDLCNGSGSYKDYCKKAKWLGVSTLGICEENTLSGTLVFQNQCEKHNIKPIIGETIVIQHNLHFQYHIKLFCKNEQGWRNLLRINSKINTSSSKSISLQDLDQYKEGLICVLTPTISLKEIYKNFPKFEEIYYQLDFAEWSNEIKEEEWLGYIENYLLNYRDKIKPLALYDSFYIEDYQSEIQPILWRIGKRTNFKYRSEDRYFKTGSQYIDQASKLFSTDQGVEIMYKGIENTFRFEEIDFKIPVGEKHLPQYELTEEERRKFGDNEGLFWSLIETGLQDKVISKGIDPDPYIERIQEEVRVIELGQVRDYFLIVWDILNFCKKNKILTGIGRGSAAGCLISYLLGIVQIDPLQYGLLFERFLNEGRVGKSMPDIDNDIQGERREEVKRYIEEKYGKAYVAGIGTYGTFKIRAAMKDLIRECGGDGKEANYISAAIGSEDKFINLFEHSLKTGSNPRIYNFVKKHSYQLNHIPTIFQQPKNQSIHAAGVIIVPKDRGEIFEQLPVKSMNDNVIITEWEGGELEEAGFLKVDILGIKQLDKFDEIFKSIKELRGEDVSLEMIPLDDRKVYSYFQKGWNEDVFQFGGGGLKGYCKVLLPDNIEDLIATVALYRPGPIETGAHEDYAAIKNGEKEPECYYGLEEITKNTYSKIVYQEQIMQIVQHLGGFTLVEADDIRKAMGKKIPEVMAKYKEKFIQGAVNNNCPLEEAESLWDDMERFAGYAFNRCISGKERIYRTSQNKSGKSSYWPTIEEMYKIKNDLEYAKSVGKISLRKKYNRQGYPHSFSLNEDNKLIKNKIKDIRLVGEKEVFEVKTESGRSIRVTSNHKFPTSNGEKKLEDIDVEKDCLYVNLGFVRYDSSYRFGEKGEQGFQKQDTDYSRWKDLMKNKPICCELCSKEGRIEMHHRDGNHGNNVKENIQYLCVSCHKKQDYLIGRNRMGEAGLQIKLEKIISIKSLGIDVVYDVEMENPYHTFVVESGIVTSNSHAACYAITGYYSQWLKCNYPIEFWLTSLKHSNDQDLQARISEIKSIGDGIKISGPDINFSTTDYKGDVETNTIYWSLSSIKYVGENAVLNIMKIREKESFFDFDSFIQVVEEDKERRKSLLKKGERLLSPINRRTILHLIVAGAFDKIERVAHPSERRDIIGKYYRKLHPELEDIEYQNILWKERLGEDWYSLLNCKQDYKWVLEQRRVSGFGSINFIEILNTLRFDKGVYYNNIDLLSLPLQDNKSVETVICAGVVEEIRIRSSVKGEFAQLLIHDGYHEAIVMVWAEIYEKYSNEILNSKGKLFFMNGEVTYDGRYKKQNIMNSKSFSTVKIL